MIYVIEGGAGIYKIGRTAGDPRYRLRTFQGGSPVPLALVGTMPGGFHEEYELQEEFARFRVHGEWFALDRASITSLKNRLALAPLVERKIRPLRRRSATVRYTTMPGGIMAKKTDQSIPVHIIVVLDRSGSMESLKADVIGGFNKFLAEQQANKGKCRMTLVQFDTQGPFEILYDAEPIANIRPLTNETFVPRGGTPLLDAEGRAIGKMRQRAIDRQEVGKKAEAVIFVTYTDGEENSSREFDFARLSAEKKACEEAGWIFIYLGVGHDGYDQAAHIGTRVLNTSSVRATPQGVAASYAGASQVITGLRGAALVGDTVTLDCAVTNAYAATNTAKADEDDEVSYTSTKS